MYANLGEAAQADRRVLNILASDISHVEALNQINALDAEFQTSETAVRRWRSAWLAQKEISPDEELAEDVGDGMALDDPESHVEEGWKGFQESDREAIHRRLDAALSAVNANPDDVAGLRVSTYQSLTKDDEGEAHIHDLYAVKLLVKTKEAEPEWPLVQRAPVTPVSFTPTTPPLARNSYSGWRTALILPDIQAGFYHDNYGQLHPTHDPAALNVALQILAQVQPDTILVGGDGVDFPELGRYRLSPVFARTTQATIDWVEAFAAQLRAIAPGAAIEWLEGNHEMRLSNYILDNAKAAFGLKQANAPESWPVLSLPFLSRFEEHGIRYHAGYPAAEYWFNDRIKAMHGHKVNSTGSTVHRYLGDERVSTISFHIHRREWGERTRSTRDGAKTIMAASPGCLCRIDGAVPSVKGGIDQHGVPLVHHEDWQQGLAILHYREGDGEFVYEQVAIHDGWAMFRGREYLSQVTTEEI